MAHVHDSGATIIADRQGMSAVVIGILAAALIGFMIWFFAFSGVVFDRGGSGSGGTTNIEQNTNTGGNTGQTAEASPAPASS